MTLAQCIDVCWAAENVEALAGKFTSQSAPATSKLFRIGGRWGYKIAHVRSGEKFGKLLLCVRMVTGVEDHV